MKKILAMMTAAVLSLAAQAMPYEEARERAHFLTDKMAYELNLNDEQYNDAYEINLDYLMNIQTAADASGIYWEYRNADLRHILYDWQFSLFCAADYFFRPGIWQTAGWFFPIVNIYPAARFYYRPPRVYYSYLGGHYHYRFSHPVSFYADRRPAWNRGLRGEHRGPVTSRPTPPRDNTGFRMERTNHPGNRPQPNAGPATGNRFGQNDRRQPASPSGTAGRPAGPSGNNRNEATQPGTGNRPAGATSPDRSNSRQTGTRIQNQFTGTSTTPAANRRTESGYNRPSSTRTTVNSTTRTSGITSRQSTPVMQRSTSQSPAGIRTGISAQRSGGASRGRR